MLIEIFLHNFIEISSSTTDICDINSTKGKFKQGAEIITLGVRGYTKSPDQFHSYAVNHIKG